MNAIQEIRNDELRWYRPERLRRRYELRAGDDVVGTLCWKKRSLSIATVETADGQWTFERKGVLRQRVIVRARGTGAEVATFAARWNSSGTLTCVNSHTFVRAPINAWQTHWAWKDGTGRLLVQTKGKQVSVYPAAVSRSELALLMLLGQYVRVSQTQQG